VVAVRRNTCVGRFGVDLGRATVDNGRQRGEHSGPERTPPWFGLSLLFHDHVDRDLHGGPLFEPHRDSSGALRLIAVSVAVAFGLIPSSGDASPAHWSGTPTLQQLIGQKLVVRMDGTRPSASLLARARLGQIGGVIIHRFNFDSARDLRAITGSLQRAAAAGGQPPLLIAVDQEGGRVKTVPWIPPTISASQTGSNGTALRQGQATGAALRKLGINTDFAPVADVPTSTTSFLHQQGRTWSFRVHRTARLSGWFGVGLGRGGALATAKHFPGLGRAARDTDHYVVRIGATKATLAPGLKPFRTAVADHVPLIMLSNAIYTAYDPWNAAAWSRTIGTHLLRGQLGFRGVTITDSLDGAAHQRGTTSSALAVRAAKAGTDLLLVTGSEPTSEDVYRVVLRAAAEGRIDRTGLIASYRRILALKSTLRAS
jgi:beta-N-acetylhexosaminidase